MKRQRVVVTGLGGICALGVNVAAIWREMIDGRSAIGPITAAAAHGFIGRPGAEIKQLPDHGLDRKRLMTMDRFSLLAVIAAGEALRQAGVTIDTANARRVGAAIGVGAYGTETMEENYRAIYVEGKLRPNVFSVPRIMPSAPAGQISMQYGATGPVFAVTSACSSSNHAIAAAADQIRLGRADMMIAGGTDAPLSFGFLRGWDALRAMGRETCRPFSADRDGLIIGEGAGMLVLETEDHAKARGATILAEFAGAGLSGDAGDIVSPTIEGPIAAISAALADSGLSPGDIDYINAHGTATKANDMTETAAIRRVFGGDANRLSLSSTKSMHGHCMGASGAIESIACILAMRDGIVPPTANYRVADPDCDLDVTPNTARRRDVRATMNNAFAFGGTNAVVCFTRP